MRKVTAGLHRLKPLASDGRGSEGWINAWQASASKPFQYQVVAQALCCNPYLLRCKRVKACTRRMSCSLTIVVPAFS